jgi:hypothetical protein
MPEDHTRFPVIQDINWYCPNCRRTVRARLVAYPDQIAITCALNGKHRFTYKPTDEIPGWTSFQNPGRSAGEED